MAPQPSHQDLLNAINQLELKLDGITPSAVTDILSRVTFIENQLPPLFNALTTIQCQLDVLLAVAYNQNPSQVSNIINCLNNAGCNLPNPPFCS
ncbi:hypothetical protein ACWGJQ_20715 [Peribacillus simplex]